MIAPPDLRPRVNWDAKRLQREWDLASAEERNEIYLPWLAAAKKVAKEEKSMEPAQFAMQKVLDSRAALGVGMLRKVFEIFGVEGVEYIPPPVVPVPVVEPVQAKLF